MELLARPLIVVKQELLRVQQEVTIHDLRPVRGGGVLGEVFPRNAVDLDLELLLHNIPSESEPSQAFEH